MIYILFYTGLLFGAWTANTREILQRRPSGAYAVLLAVTFIIVAFRYDVGCDFFSYRTHFWKFSGAVFADVLAQKEILYWLLVYILTELDLNFFYSTLFGAVIYFLGLHAIARREYSPLFFFALTFPILTTNLGMSALRQAIALGFLCFAFNAFRDRKILKYTLYCLLAAGFHSSALLFFGLLPILKWGFSDIRIIVASVASSFVAVIALQSSVYETYSELYVNTNVDAVGGIFRTITLGITGIYFIFFSRHRWRIAFPKDYDFFFITSIIMIAVPPLTLYSSVMGDRIGYYFAIPQYMIWSRAYLLYTGDLRTLTTIAPAIILLVQLVGWVSLSWIFVSCYGNYSMWLGP